MIPGIGTIVNGVGVLVVGILSRVIFKKELKDFEDESQKVIKIFEGVEGATRTFTMSKQKAQKD